PAFRVRREVRVLGKDVLGGNVLLELNQEAGSADVSVERVEWLHRVRLLRRDVALAQRRHSQVDEGMPQRRLAVQAPRRLLGDRVRHLGQAATGSATQRRSVPRLPADMSCLIWSMRRYRGPSKSSNLSPIALYASEG